MQVFRLVDPGRVDRILAFDSLPDSVIYGIKRGTSNGLPSNWLSFLNVKRSDKDAHPFYVLDFRTLNRDREKWQEISNYVRRSTDKNFRLMDNLYDMTKPMAPDSHSSLELEPEDIVVIPVPIEIKEEKIVNKIEEIEKKTDAVLEKPTVIPVVEPTAIQIKKRGRPRKVVEAIAA